MQCSLKRDWSDSASRIRKITPVQRTMLFAVLEQENRNASRSEELRLLYVAMTRAKQQLFLPLNLKKVRTRTTDYLAQYSTLILPDGTLPPLTVQNAGSMAHWVWMCLVLRHDAVLAREINLPPQCWNVCKGGYTDVRRIL